MIYDCFRFLNENDMLELRFEQHLFVDKFVIIESNQTTSGLPKDYNFDFKRFRHYKDKIIYIQLGSLDGDEQEIFKKNSVAWNRELVHHGALKQLLPLLTKKDIIIWSDADEFLKEKPQYGNFRYISGLYYYYFNNRLYDKYTGKFIPWQYQVSFTKDILEKYNPFHLRNSNTIDWNIVDNAGWHFAYVNDIEKLKYKMEAAAHQEYNTRKIKDELSEKIKKGVDFASDRYPGMFTPLSELPQYIIDKKEKYDKFILKEPLMSSVPTISIREKRLALLRKQAEEIDKQKRIHEANCRARKNQPFIQKKIIQKNNAPIVPSFNDKEFNILLLGSLGDIICNSVVVNNIKLAYPKTTINWYIAEKYSKISDNILGVDNWIIADDILGAPINEIDKQQVLVRELIKHKPNLIVLRECDNTQYGSNWKNSGGNIMEIAIKDINRFVSIPIAEKKGTFTILREDILKWRNWVKDQEKYIFWEFLPISTTPLLSPTEYFHLANKIYDDTGQKSIFSCSVEQAKRYAKHNSENIRLCALSLAQVAQGIKEQGSIFIGCSSAQTWAVCETSDTPILEIIHPDVLKVLPNITVKDSHYNNSTEVIDIKSYDLIGEAVARLKK